MRKRIRDDGRSLHAFIDHVDVACPRCSSRALVRMLERPTATTLSAHPARLTCSQCGLTRTQRLAPSALWSYALRSDGRDPYFQLPLWLQTPTRHGLVFAYNAAHLEALETYIGAQLRERSANPLLRWHNRTMASRLPRWMKSAHNRDVMLAALARLRTTL